MRLFTLLLAIGLAGAAFAQSAQDAIIEELRADGYTSVTTSRTLLGRVRIVAERPGREREIVFNPRTGVILRDYVIFLVTSDDDDPVLALPGQTSGLASEGGEEEGAPNGSDDGDDDDDDPEDDDDDDEDDDDDDEDDEDEDDDDDDEE